MNDIATFVQPKQTSLPFQTSTVIGERMQTSRSSQIAKTAGVQLIETTMIDVTAIDKVIAEMTTEEAIEQTWIR
jgi:hypothetical protein